MLQLTNIPKTNRKKQYPKAAYFVWPYVSPTATLQPSPLNRWQHRWWKCHETPRCSWRWGWGCCTSGPCHWRRGIFVGFRGSIGEKKKGLEPWLIHGLSMGYPWVIHIFHAYSHEYSYSIHSPFIFHSYSIHIPFIFHSYWYALEIW